MQKIRINDLARELEVKSKMILDALIKVGVTEKKTHSSSIEVDEAERVKKYFAEHAEPGTSRTSSRASAEEFKPKIDLSHISKPGDVLKAVTQRAAQPSAVRPTAPPSLATPAGPRQTVAPPSAVRAASSIAKPGTAIASAAPITPAEPPKPAPRFITPQSVARPPAAIVIPPKPPVTTRPATRPTHLSPATATAQPSEPAIENQITALEEGEALPSTSPSTSEAIESEILTATEDGVPAAILEAQPVTENRAAVKHPTAPGQSAQGIGRPSLPTRPGQPGIAAHAPRRLIVPQTGPRPVYLAPPSAPVRADTNALPRGAMPERGKPIFQRPRPGAAAAPGQARPPVRPGERRGPHPTRSGAPGARPGFGAGTGQAQPPPTGQRPAGRPARPGQRYVPRGVKEGPMKGFVPPPRLSLSSEPLPITRSITIPEGISVKDLAEKLGIRAKDAYRPLAGARGFCHGQPDTRFRLGDRHGSSLRRRDSRYHL